MNSKNTKITDDELLTEILVKRSCLFEIRKKYNISYCGLRWRIIHGSLSNMKLTEIIKRNYEERRKKRGICSLENCENPHFSKTLCQKHYNKNRRVYGYAYKEAPFKSMTKESYWKEMRKLMYPYIFNKFKQEQK